MLKGKTLLLGVSGGIACYKTVSLVSALKKLNCNTKVVMTKNATEFISPMLFEEFTGKRTMVDTFDRNHSFDVAHISLADSADMVLIAPATANVIAKLANGIADDMLTTSVLACKCPIYISPSMNTNMLKNPATQANIAKLKEYGYHIIEPDNGMLLCGVSGEGKMPEPEVLLEYVMRELASEKDLIGKNVLITAGPTKEKIDPVRFITNHSTGKMGYELARAAVYRGANVTLVSGEVALKSPAFVNFISVKSAEDMFEAVTSKASEQDIIIKSAAVADYRPLDPVDEKMKKTATDGDISIKLERTKDILSHLGKNKKDGQFLCGFSMETQNVLENSRKKLISKNCDMICANSIKDEGAGFGVPTNRVCIITAEGEKELPLMSKFDVANEILNEITARIK